MQADYRTRYDLPKESLADSAHVRELKRGRQFFQSDDGQLKRNYASAKAEVARWLEGVGVQSLYFRLERIRQGEDFAAATAK